MSNHYRPLHDPEHGEYFLDPSGKAYNAARERVPELDAPPALERATLDRTEVVRVLAEHYGRYRAAQRNPFHPSLANAAGYYADEVADLANDLGLGEDLDAAVKDHQSALAEEDLP